MDVGWQYFADVLKMADGKRGERRCRALDTFPVAYAIIHHHRSAQYSTVQSGSDQRAGFQTPEAGLPWQLCAAAVTMAATAVGGGGLKRAPVPAGSARHWRATGPLLRAMGLQTLGLIQVPATHLGIAGQEL